MFLDLTQPSILRHPQWRPALMIAQVLRQNGHDVLLAGGCVRDFLLNRQAVDIDIATSARPEDVESLFAKTVAVGKSFGVIRVHIEGQELEVASFRKDGLYVDGRRPENIEFSSPLEDAERRDFTINAMFLNPFNGEVLDYVGGLQDLNARLIRAVGVAQKRFTEDHLRILRALRFVSQIGFDLETNTLEAGRSLGAHLLKVSAERRLQELHKFLMGEYLDKAWALSLQMNIWPFISETGKLWNFAKVPPQWIVAMQRFSSLGCWYAVFISLGIKKDQAMDFAKELKFSVKDQRHLQSALELAGNFSTLLSLKTGEWLMAHQQSGSLLFQLQEATGFLALSSEQKTIWNQRTNLFLKLGVKWPEPILRGEHLQAEYQGIKLGQALKWSYARQLEGAFSEVEKGIELCKANSFEGENDGTK